MKTVLNDKYTLIYDIVLVSTLITLTKDYSLSVFFNSSVMFLLRLFALFLSFLLFPISLQKHKNKDYPYIILSMILVLIVGYTSEWLISMWLCFVVIIASKGISFKHIVKVHFFSMTFFCLTNMFADEMGWTNKIFRVVEDRENIFGDFAARKGYGYLASTDYANHVIFILLDYWLLRGGKLRFLECLVYIMISFFIYVNCNARLAALCILLIICLSPVAVLLRMHKGFFYMLIKWLLLLSIPIFAFLSLYITVAYDETNFNWILIDTILSGRLSCAQGTLQEYGIQWFGQSFVLYGSGNVDMINTYDYVDSSYVQYYMRWGWLLTSLLIYLYYRIGKESLKRNDTVLLLSLFLAGLVGVICQFLFHLGYCVLLLALCSSYYSKKCNMQNSVL